MVVVKIMFLLHKPVDPTSSTPLLSNKNRVDQIVKAKERLFEPKHPPLKSHQGLIANKKSFSYVNRTHAKMKLEPYSRGYNGGLGVPDHTEGLKDVRYISLK